MSAVALLIFYFSLALGVSFACSVLEAVLLSVRRTFIERMKQEGVKGARAWDRLRENRSRALAAILILNTVAHTFGAAGVGAKAMVVFERDGREHEIVFDQLLVAVGRKPNVEGLGLEAAGVEYDRFGVTVDDRLRTSNRRIYACGDVASRFKFTHTADAQARIVIQNALFYGRAKASKLVVPWCTYTSPEIAHVGMYEKQARERGLSCETITVPLSEVDRAVLDGEEEGFLRVLHHKGKILGATLVAAHAGDMIGELALAITAGVSLGQISATIHPYPTQGEIVRKVGDAYRREALTPRVRKLFAAWFRLLS